MRKIAAVSRPQPPLSCPFHAEDMCSRHWYDPNTARGCAHVFSRLENNSVYVLTSERRSKVREEHIELCV